MTDPSPSRPQRPLAGGTATEWAPGRGTFRIYHRGPYTFEATQRRVWGPHGRFDHHDPPDPPQDDPDGRSVLYVAEALRTALRECSLEREARPLRPGGREIVEICPAWRVAYLEPRGGRAVLQDLATDAVGIAAPVDLGDGNWSRPVTQAWARAIYEDRPSDDRVCGVLYWSAKDRGSIGERSGRNRVLWETSPRVWVRQPGRGEQGTEEYRLQHPTILPKVAAILAERGFLTRDIGHDDCETCRSMAAP